MAFTEIAPARGRHPLATSAITCAWYVGGTKGRVEARLRVNIGAAIARELGWGGPLKLKVERDPDQGVLRLTRAERAGWSVSWKNGTGSLMIALAGVESDARTAEKCPHRMEAGGLLLALPDWAAPGATATPDWAADDARDEAASDAAGADDDAPLGGITPPSPILEPPRDPEAFRAAAEQRLAAGQPALRVAQDLDLPEAAVIRWSNEMVTRRNGTPAAKQNGRGSAWA